MDNFPGLLIAGQIAFRFVFPELNQQFDHNFMLSIKDRKTRLELFS